MKFKYLIILPLLLSACAQTPQDVLKDNNRFVFSGSRDIESTAKCVASGAARYDAVFMGQEWKQDYGYEVQVRVPTTVVVVYKITQKQGGSKIDAYVSNNLIGDKQKVAEGIVKPCL